MAKTDRVVTAEVQAICEMVQGYYGDVLSPSWNDVLCEKHDRKGKEIKRTHQFAMRLLARVILMYTATPIYNEQGKIIDYQRKFNGPYWRPNWPELADDFGCSTRTLKDELAFLKALGLVTTKPVRERTASDGVKNIPEFLIPVATAIAAITPRHGAAKPAPEKKERKGVKVGSIGNGEETSPAPSEETSPAPSEETSPAPTGKKADAKPVITKAERDEMFDTIADVWSMDKSFQASRIAQFANACLSKNPRPTREDLQYVRDWMTAFAYECKDVFNVNAVGKYWQQAMNDRAAYPNDTIEQLTIVKRAEQAQRRASNGRSNFEPRGRNSGQVDYSDPAKRQAARQRAAA